jgi:hypothetical protein
MNFSRVLLLTVACAILVPAVAADRVRGAEARRVLAQCMLARMRANQRESYLDANKSCKEQLAASAIHRQPSIAMNDLGVAQPKH